MKGISTKAYVRVAEGGAHPVTISLGHGREYGVTPALADGAPVVASLSIRRTDGAPLTVADLRAPLARLAKLAAPLVFGGSEDPFTDLALAVVPEGRAHPDEHYKRVAAVVASARKRGQPARAAVQKRWRVSLPTVDKWLAKAKALGYIETDLRRRGTKHEQ